MDPKTKALVLAIMKQRQSQNAPDEEQLLATRDDEEGMPEVALEGANEPEAVEVEGEAPSLREQLNAEPLAGGASDVDADGEVGEGDDAAVDDELLTHLSQGGKGTPLLQRVLEALSKKKKG